MAGIVTVASMFGAAQVREQRHRAYVPLAASVDAAGFEVRRELLPAGLDDTISADLLATLGHLMVAHGLQAVYSTPTVLYADAGVLNMVAVQGALVKVQILSARIVKFQLGGLAGDASTELLARLLQDWQARALVEDGQQAMGGSLSQFQGLFGALETADVADILGMTFDADNWEQAGEAPLTCAQALASYVEYIHYRSVVDGGARRFTVAPMDNDARFAAVLAALPGDVPRGIGLPLNTVDPAADAHQHVMWLEVA